MRTPDSLEAFLDSIFTSETNKLLNQIHDLRGKAQEHVDANGLDRIPDEWVAGQIDLGGFIRDGQKFPGIRDSMETLLGDINLGNYGQEEVEQIYQWLIDYLIDELQQDITQSSSSDAKAAAARAFNEAYAPRILTASAGVSDVASNAPLEHTQALIAQQNITPLMEDFSNFAVVEEEVYQKLLGVNEELANLGEGQDATALEQTGKILTEAAHALENIQTSGMIPQEYPDTEPGLSEPGMDAEGYDNVAASAAMAAEALAGLMTQVYELGND